MSHFWFYADTRNQQQGPVAQALLISLFQRGELKVGSLVWREGMGNWVPLSQVAGELGLSVSAMPPALPQGGRPSIVKPASSNVWLIVVIVAFGLFAVMGILAAIAIPAYSDYVARAKVAGARTTALSLKATVEEFYLSNDRCPENGDGGIAAAETYASDSLSAIEVGTDDDGACTIKLTFRNLGASGTEGAELEMRRTGIGQWTESSNLPNRYLPAALRR